MVKVEIKGNEIISLRVKDFWEQSVNGFGIFSQEISKTLYNKHTKNKSHSIVEGNYIVMFSKINDTFFIFIKK